MRHKCMVCLILGILLAILSACQPAIIESQLRETSVNDRMITRCVEIDMRDNAEMESILKQYDGWRMIYISEYTTGNRVGTDAAVCFEKPMQ